MAERTPLFKHPLVVLLGPFCPGVSDLPGNVFSDATLGTDGDVSLHAVNWMLFMTFGIVSLVVTFHRSHYDDLNLLGGFITRHMVSGNQL